MEGRSVFYRPETLTSANLLLIGNLGVEVAAVGVVHHNAQASFVHEGLFIGNDIRMSHSFEHMHLKSIQN